MMAGRLVIGQQFPSGPIRATDGSSQVKVVDIA